MARRQYRWFSSGLWLSQSGNAVFAIFNPVLSGKRVTIHQIEVHPQKRDSASYRSRYDIITGSSTIEINRLSGEIVYPCPFDSQYPLPPSIAIRKNATVDISSDALFTGLLIRNLTSGIVCWSTAWGSKNCKLRNGKDISSWFVDFCQDSHLQPVTLNQNEFLAITNMGTSPTTYDGIPVEVQCVFKYEGHTYSCIEAPCFLSYTSNAFFIYNKTTSPIYIKRLFIREIGTSDTPYFQLVPVGAVDPNTLGDNIRIGKSVPMDTSYGSPVSGDPIILVDTPMLPYGVPQAYITDASSGSPKGFNYLHTKDFRGPVYGVIFPEYATISSAVTGLLGWRMRARRLTDSRFNIVLNEGEGIALVSAAETAILGTGQHSVGVSGWQPYDFSIVYSVEPKNIPIIKATGIVEGSTWCIQKKSTGQVVAQGTVGSSGIIEYTYYDEDTPLTLVLKIRKGTNPPYYKPYEVEFLLTTDGVTIPVSQIPD